MQCTFNLRIFQKKKTEIMQKKQKQQHTYINLFSIEHKILARNNLPYCEYSASQILLIMFFKYQTY